MYTDYHPTPLQHYLFPAGADGLYLVLDEQGEPLEWLSTFLRIFMHGLMVVEQIDLSCRLCLSLLLASSGGG